MCRISYDAERDEESTHSYASHNCSVTFGCKNELFLCHVVASDHSHSMESAVALNSMTSEAENKKLKFNYEYVSIRVSE